MTHSKSHRIPEKLLMIIIDDYLVFPHIKQREKELIDLNIDYDEFGRRCLKERFFIICNSDPQEPRERVFKVGMLAFISDYKVVGDVICCKIHLPNRVKVKEVRTVILNDGKYLAATWRAAPDKIIPIDYWNSKAFKSNLVLFAATYAEVYISLTDELNNLDSIAGESADQENKLKANYEIILREGVRILKMLTKPERTQFGGLIDRIANIILTSVICLSHDGRVHPGLLSIMRDLFIEIDVVRRFTLIQLILIKFMSRYKERIIKKRRILSRKKGTSLQIKYDEIKERIPDDARAAIEYELTRMDRHDGPVQMVREHLELLLNVPWGIYTEDEKDLSKVQLKLNESHSGLKKIKERILEYIAILQQNPKSRAPILCFVGPPGVGKTSLGQAIATALGRKFTRLSLGGMTDESEVKGHRGTYINAKPGRIIDSLRRAGSANPVFMLDELDKIGTHWRGNPSATLLEVLDPEQNKNFLDTYLDVPFDLSRVLFITTANMVNTINPALLDRLEIIDIPSYTPQEKLEIAKNHLITRRKNENGFPQIINGQVVDVVFPDESIIKIIDEYTEEAGVRNLERVLDKPYRKLARNIRLGPDLHKENLILDHSNITEWCGKPEIIRDVLPEVLPTGVVPVLAVNETGGFIYLVEVGFKSSGSTRKIAITGILPSGANKETVNLLEESFRCAWDALTDVGGIFANKLKELEILHGPLFVGSNITGSGIPKDGPSAGISLYLALYGLYTDQSIKPRKDVPLLASTGAITKRIEMVDAVGGIRNKLIRAEREGVKRVIIPYKNLHDIDDVPEEVKSSLEIIPIKYMWEALSIAYPDDEQIKAYIKSKLSTSAIPV